MLVNFDRTFDASVLQIPRELSANRSIKLDAAELKNKDPITISADARCLSLMEKTIVVTAAFLSDCTWSMAVLTIR